MTDRLTLVTGATGSVGSLLVTALAEARRPVRALARDATKAAPLAEAGAQLAVADLAAPASLAPAMQGVDTVVLITPAAADAAELTKHAIEAAGAAGVRRIVRLSVIRPDDRLPTDNVRQHARTEEDLLAAPVSHAIVRPHFFMQNLLMSARSIAEEGHLRWGMGDGRLGMIDARDVADALHSVVAEPDAHDGAVHTLTGPAAITFTEVAEALQEALGRPVTYTAISPEAVEQALEQMGAGDWFPAVMRDYSRAYADGWGDFVTGDFERLVGRPPRSIDDFAREVFAPAMRARVSP